MCGLPAKFFQTDDLTGVVKFIPGLKLPGCSVSSTASIAGYFASIGTLTRTLQVRLGSPLEECCARICAISRSIITSSAAASEMQLIRESDRPAHTRL